MEGCPKSLCTSEDEVFSRDSPFGNTSAHVDRVKLVATLANVKVLRLFYEALPFVLKLFGAGYLDEMSGVVKLEIRTGLLDFNHRATSQGFAACHSTTRFNSLSFTQITRTTLFASNCDRTGSSATVLRSST